MLNIFATLQVSLLKKHFLVVLLENVTQSALHFPYIYTCICETQCNVAYRGMKTVYHHTSVGLILIPDLHLLCQRMDEVTRIF